MIKGNPDQPPADRTQSRVEAWRGLAGIRQAAGRDRHLRFTALMHHVTVDLLREAYHALKRNAAAGVDGVTWSDYGRQLEARLPDLHQRVQSGRYRALPSKRSWIPKADGRQRPLGIASLEDKIVQQALVRVLNGIYEQDFLGFSYGFRPGRSQHHALDAVWVGVTRRKVNWVLDVDIRSFFDTLDHAWLMKMLEVRVGDRRVLRLIAKWLRAGVSEEGKWSRTEVGTPQGAVISPLLANVFLHYVFDQWVDRWRRQQAQGDVIVVRYADDVVMGFQEQAEAQRFLKELRERFAEYGLELHPDKTRLLEFGRFAEANRAKRGEGKPETFEFLGFTHICAKRRSDGGYTVQRKTIGRRLRQKAKEVGETLMRQRHQPVAQVGRWLKSVVQGFFNYHAVPGNRRSMNAFRTLINRSWLRALRRRSQKGTSLNWQRMQKLIATWIPPARVLHPYPNQRLTFVPKIGAV
jgi:group II intron reverse transcriptase/maturase